MSSTLWGNKTCLNLEAENRLMEEYLLSLANLERIYPAQNIAKSLTEARRNHLRKERFGSKYGCQKHERRFEGRVSDEVPDPHPGKSKAAKIFKRRKKAAKAKKRTGDGVVANKPRLQHHRLFNRFPKAPDIDPGYFRRRTVARIRHPGFRKVEIGKIVRDLATHLTHVPSVSQRTFDYLTAEAVAEDWVNQFKAGAVVSIDLKKFDSATRLVEKASGGLTRFTKRVALKPPKENAYFHLDQFYKETIGIYTGDRRNKLIRWSHKRS